MSPSGAPAPVPLSFRQVVAVHAICRTGSMVAAAEILHVSQPALSRMVSQLEAALGYRLFDRRNRRLTATPEALRLMPVFERVIADMDRLQRALRVAGKGDFDELTVAGNLTLVTRLAVPAVARLRAELPHVLVNLQVLGAADLARAVLAETADIGLVYGQVDHARLRMERLAASPFLAVLPRDHPLAARESLGAAELAQVPLIASSRGSTSDVLLHRFFESADRRFDPVARASNAMSVLALAVGGGWGSASWMTAIWSCPRGSVCARSRRRSPPRSGWSPAAPGRSRRPQCGCVSY